MAATQDLEDLPGVGPATAEKLEENGFDSYQGIAVASPGELSNTADVGESSAADIIQAARKAADIGGFESGVDVLERREQIGKLTWGVPEVDELLNGGLDRGTVTVLSGPTGVGKTTTGTQFMKEAAGRGEHSVMYLFEESEATFAQRSEAINIPVAKMRERGTLTVEGIEPLEVSPQEFAQKVRRQVEEEAADIVMLDGIAGYKLGIQGDEDELVTHLHSLGRYLKNMGVTVIFVDEVDTVTGEFRATNTGISYLADNIVFLRYLEYRGEIRKAAGVLKKRSSDFERTLREFAIDEEGVQFGDPLTDLGWMLSYWWDEKDPDPPESTSSLSNTFMTREGYPTRRDLVDRYEELTGFSYDNDRFYRALAVYKLAALGEMFFRRYLTGNADDPMYPKMEAGVPSMADRAMRIIEGEEPL
mgnify:CR=1 FL=1